VTNEESRALGRVESKVDAILDRLPPLEARMARSDERTDNLERWRSYLAGAYAATLLIAGIILKVLLP
jgi:hypothetical protein